MTEPNAARSDDPPPRDNTLWELFSRTVGDNPDAEAVIDTRCNRRYTYNDLHEHVTRLAGALTAAGVDRGDTFATLLRNGIEQTTSLLVASRLGAVVAPVNYRHSTSDVAHVFADCDPSLVVFDEDTHSTLDAVRTNLAVEHYLYAGKEIPEYADSYWERTTGSVDAAPPVPSLQPDDPIYLPYTAGTTGKPKGCLYTDDVVDLGRSVMDEFGFASERLLLVVPQAHAMGGWLGGTVPVLGGGTVVTMPAFDPVDALELIEAETISCLIAMPALLRALVAAEPGRFDTGSLATVLSTGSPLSPELAARVDAAFDLTAFHNAMGATEIGWFLARDVRDNPDAVRSPGTAVLDAEIRVVRLSDGDSADSNGLNTADSNDPPDECVVGEMGELIVDSPHGMDRYAGSTAATTERFRDVPASAISEETPSEETESARQWSYTGDLGYIDEVGQFWSEGRRANAITSGTITVSDVSVEEVLREHPGIADVGVVGVPDDRRGEHVVACVVPNNGSVTENLIAWAREHPDLAAYEQPREIVFFEDLPHSAAMAVQKFKLREQLAKMKKN